MKQKLIQGDCIEELKKLPDNSVDSIVTDPPYGIGFMGKKWDKFKQEKRTKSQVVNMGSGMAFPKLIELKEFQDWCELWAKECLRVLKPGGHILSFGGTRTYHRMTCAIEDAGFEIRDCIFWCYGSGFPKSHNIGKAIDKKQGNKRKVIRENPNKKGRKSDSKGSFVSDTLLGKGKNTGVYIDKGNSKWEGWGSALKPAVEPVVLGRKPLSEKTIVENVLKHGTGGLNIDGSRVGNEEITQNLYDRTPEHGNKYGNGAERKQLGIKNTTTGRFPANLILECICEEVIEGKQGEMIQGSYRKKSPKSLFDFKSKEGANQNAPDDYRDTGNIHTNPDCPCFVLDKQSGDTGCSSNREKYKGKKYGKSVFLGEGPEFNSPTYTDKGGASRYFKEIPLKPEVEPVVLGRKPLSEKTIVDNVLKHGTGGLNIDESRVLTDDYLGGGTMGGIFGNGKEASKPEAGSIGRFPANLILECICDEVIEGKEEVAKNIDFKAGTQSDMGWGTKKCITKPQKSNYNIHTNPDCPCYVLDEQSGEVGNGHWSKTKTKGYGDFGGGSSSYEGVGVKDKSKGGASRFFKEIPKGRFPANFIHDGSDEVVDKFPENKATAAGKKGSSGFASGYDGDYEIPYGDSGSAARYFKEIKGDRIFYTAKASKSERNNGLEGFEEAPIKGRDAGQDIRNVPYKQRTTPIKNSHPTVKPVKLMKYLIKLITPPNGTVLDPFMGSGTTGVAAKLEGFNFVGIEKEKDYIKIAEARIKNYKENPKKKTKPKKKVKKVKSKFWK